MGQFQKIILTIFIFFIVGLSVSFLLPFKIEVQNSITINKSSTFVYDQIANFSNWTKWYEAFKDDQQANYIFLGTMGLPGATVSFDGSTVGKGKVELSDRKFNQSLSCKESNIIPSLSEYYMEFELVEKEKGTVLSYRKYRSVSWYKRIWVYLYDDMALEKEKMDKSLKRLKNYSQKVS